MGYEKNEQILALIKAKGPILPVEASKKIGDDIIISSAYLATLVSRAEVKMSFLKVGGSPLYYLPGQEAMLQEFSDRLNPPEKKAYNLLKERKVLRDAELEPVQRVSLRQLKDFALPLNVKHENNIEIFWKWYLLADAEAEPLIKKLLHVEEPPAAKPAPAAAPVQVAPEPKPEVRPEPKKEEMPRPEPISHVARKDEEEQKPREKEPKERKKRPAKLKQEVLLPKPAEKLAATTPAPAAAALGTEQEFTEPETKDKFFEEVKEYFSANGIIVMESAIVKKNSELDLVVSVPSAVGRLTYYCKAKNKKKSNEGDLASAFVQGQSRKLPTLYLSRGDLMKKASEMLAREFRGIVVKTF